MCDPSGPPYIGLSVRTMPNSKMDRGRLIYATKRENGGQNSQKVFHSPLQWVQFLRGWDWSFQVVLRTALEVDILE